MSQIASSLLGNCIRMKSNNLFFVTSSRNNEGSRHYDCSERIFQLERIFEGSICAHKASDMFEKIQDSRFLSKRWIQLWYLVTEFFIDVLRHCRLFLPSYAPGALDSVVHAVNFIRARTLGHHALKAVWEEVFLLRTEVCCLSVGNVLSRSLNFETELAEHFTAE
jgi:hypothetical protein